MLKSLSVLKGLKPFQVFIYTNWLGAKFLLHKNLSKNLIVKFLLLLKKYKFIYNEIKQLIFKELTINYNRMPINYL